jgi:uncharacterized OB-fold protein
MTGGRPLPVVDGESTPFWEAARAGRLVLPYCPGSDRFHFFPRTVDPWSGSTRLEWRQVSGRGRIYSFTIVRQAPDPAFAPEIPYAVALIDLDEGARMLSVIDTEDLDQIEVGKRVRVVFAPVSADITLPNFRIDEAELR